MDSLARHQQWDDKFNRLLRFKFFVCLIFVIGIIMPFWLLQGRDEETTKVVETEPNFRLGGHSRGGHPNSPFRHQGKPATHPLGRPANDLINTAGSGQISNTAHDVDPYTEVITFALLMWGLPSAKEGALLVKTILMYTSHNTHIHIVCDEAARGYLEEALVLVVQPAYDVTVRFYQPSWQSILDRIDREGSITSGHSAGYAGLLKLFLQELLPESVTKAIYVDTDAFFISDPYLLWKQFESFGSDTAISMPFHPDLGTAAWLNADRICSCIMLLDLKKLRDKRLMDSKYYREADDGVSSLSGPAFQALFGDRDATSGHYEGIDLGDQTFWWAIISHYPDLFKHLSYDWEISSCILDTFNTGLGDDRTSLEAETAAQRDRTNNTPHEGRVVIPKILHFNCLDSLLYYEWSGWDDSTNSLAMRWSAAVKYHAGFKWLWLNRGEGNTTRVIVEGTGVAAFADEAFATKN